MAYLRLRQLCLVANDLDLVAGQLRAVLGLAIAYRDPVIARIGLRNVLLPAGEPPIFIEIVQPVESGVAAERYLARRRGDGGYMLISDTNDLEGVRKRAEAMGVRVIADRVHRDGAAVEEVQLHPKDSGGTMLHFDRHRSGEDMLGAYRWAGDNWRSAMRSSPVAGVIGAEIQSDEPGVIAHKWAEIFGRPVIADGGDPELRLDNAYVRFVRPRDDRGEGLSAIHLAVDNPGAIQKSAEGAGVALREGNPEVGGVRFVLST